MKRSSLLVIVALVLAPAVYATHAWSDYHWARTSNPFDLILVNSTTADWDSYVPPAALEWSASTVSTIPTVLHFDVHTGDTSSKTRRQCRPTDGQVRICNLTYGATGWLGVAGIYTDANDHIVKAYTKLNDTYFATDYYNDPIWKQAVACQELGHDLGLDHQDEDFNNTPIDTCMDYRDPPYRYPNDHDFEELAIIYGHTDSYDSYDSGAPAPSGGGGGNSCNAPPGKGCNKGEDIGGSPGNSDWGKSLGRHGQTEVFELVNPDGSRIITFVTWARGH